MSVFDPIKSWRIIEGAFPVQRGEAAPEETVHWTEDGETAWCGENVSDDQWVDGPEVNCAGCLLAQMEDERPRPDGRVPTEVVYDETPRRPPYGTMIPYSHAYEMFRWPR